jgi:hypothetical protein
VSGPEDFWGDGGPPSSAGEFAGRLWQIGREGAAKKRQVVDAIRLVQDGKSRDELRRDFEAELARQRMQRDPIWIERALDELEESSADQLSKNAQNLLLAPGHVGDTQALVPVWFDWDTDGRRVGVYVGSTRVGALDRKSSESFGAVMKAAEERGGKPRSMLPLARARHLDPPYLLVVDLP